MGAHATVSLPVCLEWLTDDRLADCYHGARLWPPLLRRRRRKSNIDTRYAAGGSGLEHTDAKSVVAEWSDL